MDILKESVHFIVKKFGVTNRTTVVFKTHIGTKNPQPSPYKWFSYKSEISPGGFTSVGDGELVTIPEKENTESNILELLGSPQIPQSSLEDGPYSCGKTP